MNMHECSNSVTSHVIMLVSLMQCIHELYRMDEDSRHMNVYIYFIRIEIYSCRYTYSLHCVCVLDHATYFEPRVMSA